MRDSDAEQDPDAILAHAVRSALIALLLGLEVWMVSRGWQVVTYDLMRAAYKRATSRR